MKGSDHKISSDFKEMQQIIRNIEYAESILGERMEELDPEEKKYRDLYRSYY
jgi:sialic acid synthase SpsE